MVERRSPQVNDLIRRRIDELEPDMRELADSVGVSYAQVYNWKNGQAEVPHWHWTALEDALGLSFGTLAEVAGVHPGRDRSAEVDKQTRAYEKLLNQQERIVRQLRDALLGRDG